MFQNSVWRLISEDFGVQHFARTLFFSKTHLFKTNYLKRLWQPWVDLVYRFYLKHQNSIWKFWNVRKFHVGIRKRILFLCWSSFLACLSLRSVSESLVLKKYAECTSACQMDFWSSNFELFFRSVGRGNGKGTVLERWWNNNGTFKER